MIIMKGDGYEELLAIVTLVLLAMLGISHPAGAHDGWIQSNVSRTIKGEMVYIDMQFGNHGNTHRDYKKSGLLNGTRGNRFFSSRSGREIINMAESVIDIGQDETKTFATVQQSTLTRTAISSPRSKPIRKVSISWTSGRTWLSAMLGTFH